MVILLSRIFERKDASTFLDKWIPIIHQVITNGSVLNWEEIISSNLDSQLKKVHSEHIFYMASYLLDAMCSSTEYPCLCWKWNMSLSSIHVYWKMLWENKYKEDYEGICNGPFAPIYQIHFGKEAQCLSLEGHEIM